MIQVLPYDLQFRQPSAAGLRVVTEFSKKTGDYAALSATDLGVLAVTYDLEVERRGAEHLNKEPVTKRTVEFYKPAKGIPVGDRNIAGFYISEKDERSAEQKDEKENFTAFQFWREPIPEIPVDFDIETETEVKDEETSVFSKADLETLDNFLKERSFVCSFEVSTVDFFLFNLLNPAMVDGFSNLKRWYSHIQSYPTPEEASSDLSVDLIKLNIRRGENFSITDVTDDRKEEYEVEEGEERDSSDEGVHMEEEEEEEDGSDKENEEDDEDGWITPSNLKEKKASMAGRQAEDARVEVACITTDFAMQNVLKQIGLNIIGPNGLIIRVSVHTPYIFTQNSKLILDV